MDPSELTQREAKEDFEQSVQSELRDVKQHLAELTDEVRLVKRSSGGSELEQLKNTVAESNSVIKLLAADFNTTRTMMLSEFRNILHAITRGDGDALQQQLITADEALREAQQAYTESLSQVEALQKELSDAKGALQQAEVDVSEGNNKQNELQRELQTTGEQFMKAQKDVHRLKGELIRVNSESSSQVKGLQVLLSDTKGTLQQAQTDLSESKDIQNELQRALQTTKEEVEKLKGELEEAKSQSCPPEKVQSQNQNQQTPSGGKKKPRPSTEEKLKRKDKDTSQDEDLLRRFKSILNKLSPQNFQKLMNQTMQLPINSEERLKGVVDLVFEKAIMKPVFSQAYANMCRIMQSIEVKKADGEPVQFRKLILIKCQKQFERDRSDEQVEKEKQRIMALTNEKEKEEALAELEYQLMIVKKQIVGNIRFIGELFKLQLLTEKVMHNCIFLLLKAKDEESLECMSILVTTVGQSLDHVKGKAIMDRYFHEVDKIIKEKKVSSIIRFMLQDLKDLRENNWKPSRSEAKPVMIDQIRKEVEQEKQRKEQEQLAARLAPRIGKRPQESKEKYQQEDGWNTVPGGRSTKQNVIENPSKLKITRQNYDENVQLGPGGRPGSFGGWGKGSSGRGGSGGKSSSGSSEAKVPQANRFQMLQEEKSSRSMLPPRDSNKSRSSSSSKRSRERDIDRSRERQAAIAETQQFTGSQRSRSSEMDRDQEKRPEPAAPSMSEDEYEKRSKATIDEYLSVKDFKEVTACINELKSSKLQHIFIRVAIENVLERKAHMRESIGRLFHRLLDEFTISLEQFKIGLKEVLEFADDMAIEIPLYWTYLGEIIGGMAAEGAQNFAFLKEPVQMVQGKSAKFMAEIMKAGVKYTSEQQMSNVWQTSRFTWDMFLPQGRNVQEFLSDNNLTFTEKPKFTKKPIERAAQIPPKEENRIGNFQRDLMLFQKENLDNNAAFDFIEESIPAELRKTKEFIRALVSAVCYGSVKGEGTNSRGDHELLQSRTVLMQRYIDGNPDLELQALYAVQHLNNSLENPPGLLRLYFDVLYDKDVISEDTFYCWRDSQDPSEKNGKGIALKSVTSFYTCLEESDPPC